jgi:sec-independent protein translocase protein TatA
MFGLGMPELLVILVIIIFIFGTSRIASLGKGLGEGIRNFKKGLKDEDDEHSHDETKTS